MSEKLLIVEDDKKLNDGIRLALKNDAYFFYQCRTLQESFDFFCSSTSDTFNGVFILSTGLQNGGKSFACGSPTFGRRRAVTEENKKEYVCNLVGNGSSKCVP